MWVHPFLMDASSAAAPAAEDDQPATAPLLGGVSATSLPKLVVFDLDFTLWPFWIDTHRTPPFSKSGSGVVTDGNGDEVELYPDVRAILAALRAAGVPVAFASRTGEPEWARAALALIPLGDGRVLGDAAAYEEIYPSSKLKHFRALASASGVACTEMLFFDDEARNAEVERLGVTFVHAPNGMSMGLFEEGLRAFAERRNR